MSNIHDKYTYQMNPAAAAIALTNGKLRPSPVFESSLLDEEEPRPPWRERFLVNLGVKTMAEPTQKPFSFWNPTVVTAWCAVLTLILGLVASLFVAGVYVGIQYNQQAQMEQKMRDDKAATDRTLEKIAADEQRRLLFEAGRNGKAGPGH